jgi:hypothetical protein
MPVEADPPSLDNCPCFNILTFQQFNASIASLPSMHYVHPGKLNGEKGKGKKGNENMGPGLNSGTGYFGDSNRRANDTTDIRTAADKPYPSHPATGPVGRATNASNKPELRKRFRPHKHYQSANNDSYDAGFPLNLFPTHARRAVTSTNKLFV